MKNIGLIPRVVLAGSIAMALCVAGDVRASTKQIVYLAAKSDLPFWNTLGKGVKAIAQESGYTYLEMDSNLNAATQLANAKKALALGVDGIVISPVDSQTAPEVLDIASKAGIPVVIADIGTNGGEFVTYVKSDNYRGAYEIGTVLAAALKDRGWSKDPFALITISLARKNGQDRTNGFIDAMKDAGSVNQVASKQMLDYSANETFRYVKDILAATPNLRGLFIETDQPVEGAMQEIKAAKKHGEVLIASFDALPQVESLLNSGTLVAVGMQQPYLMGNKAAEALIGNLHGQPQAKQVLVPILVATRKNISQLLPVAAKTVFGNEAK